MATGRDATTFNPAVITSTTLKNLDIPNTPKATILNVVVKGEIVDYLQTKMRLIPVGIRYELNAWYPSGKSAAGTFLRVRNHSIDTVIKKRKKKQR